MTAQRFAAALTDAPSKTQRPSRPIDVELTASADGYVRLKMKYCTKPVMMAYSPHTGDKKTAVLRQVCRRDGWHCTREPVPPTNG